MVGRNYCFVPGCKTGSTKDRRECKIKGKSVNNLFSPPQDPEVMKKWRAMIPKCDKELTRVDRVCSLHFKENEIERFFITKLADGSIHKLEREKPHLKEGSVPSIFPCLSDPSKNIKPITFVNVPIKEEINDQISDSSTLDALSSTEGNAIAYVDVPIKTEVNDEISDEFSSLLESNSAINVNKSNYVDVAVKTELNDQIIGDFSALAEPNASVDGHFLENYQITSNLCTSVVDSIHAKENPAFNALKEKIADIKLPNTWWRIAEVEDYIICTKWNSEYFPQKRIVIENNLEVKVFVNLVQVENEELNIDNCFHPGDVCELVNKIDRLKPCAGRVDDKFSKNCKGYVPDRTKPGGRTSLYCMNCRVSRKKMMDAARKPKKRDVTATNRKLQQQLVCADRKKLRLILKVARLREEMAQYKRGVQCVEDFFQLDFSNIPN